MSLKERPAGLSVRSTGRLLTTSCPSGGLGITANCIAPGFIMTEMTDVLADAVKDAAKQIIPVRRFGEVEDVAKAVAFLASDDSGYITGQVLCVDGGMAM